MELLQQIFAAGVVGCGGAGFPTHAKLGAKAECLIINGAECEPLLRTDRYQMIRFADRLVEAAEAAAAQLEAARVYIALKETYRDEAQSLSEAIARRGSRVLLFAADNYYPAGDEQMLTLEVTGKAVPPGGIPLDVGVVVSNVTTMLRVRDAMDGVAFTHKLLTVTGDVARPVLVRVPVGTAAAECIELAGGSLHGDNVIIDGGPLMGKATDSRAVVTKTTSGLISLKRDSYLANQHEISVAHTVNRARAACCQCTLCTQMCPRNLAGHPLEPHRIMRKLGGRGSITAMLDDDDAKQALICCECGICTIYACPMQLQPSLVNTLLKQEFSAAKIRYEKPAGQFAPRPERDMRKTPSKRIAARAGVLAYYDYIIDEVVEYEPRAVAVPLLQHIGAAAKPVVLAGDTVKRGQLIAKCPDGKLGANIHAGIDGAVVSVTDRITIERR